MKLHFLAADVALTKRFAAHPFGGVEKTPYPFVTNFTSIEEDVDTTAELHAALLSHAAQGHCLLKGVLRFPLRNESRAGSTDSLDPSQWMVLDLDGVTAPDVETFIRGTLPPEFHEVSYVLQWSASHGFSDTPGLRCHVFFLMREAYQPELAKQWLTFLNLTNPGLMAQISLTASGAALKFPLDRTVVQNDKLIYIAPPICEGVVDPHAGQRILHVVKDQDRVAFAFPADVVGRAEEQSRAKVNELRQAAGLRRKTLRTKYVQNVGHVVQNPDHAQVTSEKRARGFVYLNLNGGDSFAYWYPEGNPKYLYNFKGEPIYVMADIVPEYFARVREELGAGAEIVPFAFRHHASDAFWNGTYDPVNDRILSIAQTSGNKKITDFFAQFDLDAPFNMPDFTFEFQPWNDTVFDAEAKFCNRFERTQYMRLAKPSDHCPPTIDRIIHSIMGDDPVCVQHFKNWLAFIFQKRTKTGTAWVAHGVEGTGKGVFYSHVLMPLFGEKYCVLKQLRDLDDKFNAELETNLIFVLDESKISSQPNAARTMAQLKSLITEPYLNVRAMRANATQVRNYSNFLFYSNDYDALAISATDRRFNVAPRQEKRITLTPDNIAQVHAELNDFASFLAGYKVDEIQARTSLNNPAKAAMRDAAQDAFEQLCQAVQDGNLPYFVQFIEAEAPGLQDVMSFSAYKNALRVWIHNVGMPMVVTQAQLNSVFTYLVPTSKGQGPQKFLKRLAHKQLLMKDSDNVSTGVRVTWKATPQQLKQWARHFDDAAPPQRTLQSVNG